VTKEGPGAALDKHGGDVERCRKEATDSITESVVGNGFLLKEGRFRLHIRKKREVDALSLETFKVRLEGLCAPDGAVGILVHCRVGL